MNTDPTLWLHRTLRLVLGGLFLWAGIVKLSDVYGFQYIIEEYGLAPLETTYFLARGLPILEILAGLALILNIRGGLAVITGMLLLFIGVLWYGMFHNLDIDCGCFGVEAKHEINSLRAAFYRDLIMLGIALAIHVINRLRKELRPRPITGLLSRS